MNIEDFFNKEENEIEEEDYIKYHNFRHKEIKHTKAKTKPKTQKKKKEKNSNNKNISKEEEEEKLIKQKSESGKNKRNLSELSKIELFFLNLFKKVNFIRESKMIYQIITIYIILFIAFLIIVISSKQFLIKHALNHFDNVNYASFLTDDVIRVQNELKYKTDTKNNNNMIATLDEQLLFMEIYTKELLMHNILIKDIFENLDKEDLEKYEDELGESFKTTISIKNLVNEDIETSDNYNIKNLIPFYYHFVPVIFQNFNIVGFNLVNCYFIGNDNNCNVDDEEEKINNLYFKYPLEDNNLGIDFKALNNKIYDYIIDPFIDCNNGYDFDEKLLEFIKENNWYYNMIREEEDKNSEVHFRFLKLIKINQQNVRKDFYIA